jgi:phosphodiesterase/alkaline phosphatase D-like protein
VNTATALMFSNTTLMTAHTAPLSGLAPSTQYFFIATSADGAGNTATSTESSFTTAAADITSPLISAVTASGITSSTATVGWTTNEAATSKIYYATSSPVDTATASSVSDTTLVTSHSLNLSGLTASSTYYYLVESKDASLNTATSTEFSFPTL